MEVKEGKRERGLGEKKGKVMGDECRICGYGDGWAVLSQDRVEVK